MEKKNRDVVREKLSLRNWSINKNTMKFTVHNSLCDAQGLTMRN